MAVTNAATLPSPSVPETPADSTRSRLSAALLLCRFWTVAAALLAFGSLPASSFFMLRDVRIEGNRHVPTASVRALSAVSVGAPVAGFDPAEIARRVRGHPEVASAEVMVAGGTVTIRITERTPAAAIPVGGRYAIVDAAGIVMAERADPGALPVIAMEASALPWVRVGTAVPSAVPQAIDALSTLPAAVPRAGLRLRRGPQGDLSIVTADGIVVRLGDIGGLRDRAAMLPQVLATVRSQHLVLEYIDLRFAGNVILKPATGASAGAPRAGDRP